MSKVFLIIRVTIYVIAFVWIWYWMAQQVMPLDERFGVVLPAWVQPPGLILGIGGGLLAFWCIAEFMSRGRGTPAPFDAPRDFVSSGPYNYVRNPMYLGGLAGLFGFGLVLRSVSMIGVGMVFILLMHLFVVWYEEPTLERRFGESYSAYKRAVPRWIPRF